MKAKRGREGRMINSQYYYWLMRIARLLYCIFVVAIRALGERPTHVIVLV
jgi:hypothetical protein